MNDEMKIKKLTIESESWFIRYEDLKSSHDVLKNQFTALKADKGKLEERNKSQHSTISNLSWRLELIDDLHDACRATGYISPFKVGGVTVECLQEEIEKARKFKQPIMQYPGGSIDFQRPPLRNSRETREYMDQLEQAIRKTLIAGKK